jgi:hypothetical protein
MSNKNLKSDEYGKHKRIQDGKDAKSRHMTIFYYIFIKTQHTLVSKNVVLLSFPIAFTRYKYDVLFFVAIF